MRSTHWGMETLHLYTEFSRLIPPHTPAELELLEESILREGCRDPIVVWRGILLDGHARYRICRKHNLPYRIRAINLPDRDAARLWIIRNQFARRNLPIGARCALALQLEADVVAQARANKQSGKPAAQPVNTDAILAGIAGVSRQTMQRYRKIHGRATAKEKRAIDAGETTINHVWLMHHEYDEQRKAAKRRAEARPDHLDNLFLGDFRKSKIPDGSLSLIVTDPPWNVSPENIALLDDLAVWAERKLEVGGKFVCYVGHILTPHAMAAFNKHLRYHWSFCARRHHPIAPDRNKAQYYRINVGWRLILLYVKGKWHSGEDYLTDYMEFSKREKIYHPWQQPLPESEYFIRNLCPKNGVVGDPFAGSGTVAVAAERCKRHWIGSEMDPKTYNIAVGRIKEERRSPSKMTPPAKAAAKATRGKHLLLNGKPIRIVTTMMPLHKAP